jgi:hypothetical protein
MKYTLLIGVSALVALAGCETPAPRSTPVRTAAPEPAPPPPPPRVYFYPTQGQTDAQQDRDRYECYNWAVKQTGFDPGRRSLPPQQRVAVVPSPAPGTATLAGAVTGAIIGAAVSGPGHTGSGLIVGAAAGGLLGSAAEASQAQEAEQLERRIESRDSRRGEVRYQREAAEYRRAMSACLEGRGYSVK